MDDATGDAHASVERLTHVALRLLVDCAPGWVVVERVLRDEVLLRVQAIQGSGKKGRQYTLRLTLGKKGKVEVGERERDLLPPSCPERHINDDGTFCLGYEAGIQVKDAPSAGQWWEKLRSFVLCQDTASNTGHWPDYAVLSHADAGVFQMVGESAAEELGRLEDFKAAMHGRGPIAEDVWQVKDDAKDLLNLRMSCICGRIGRRGKLKLRKECRKAQEPCLVILEAERRDAEELFWKSRKGDACCGTMAKCPLDAKWKSLPDRRALRRSTNSRGSAAARPSSKSKK